MLRKIRESNRVLELSVANSAEDLNEVKRLDDKYLGHYQAVTKRELLDIAEAGYIFTLKDAKTGELVGHTQILLRSTTHQQVHPEEGYCYGTVGPGFGKILFSAQEEVAIQAGKRRLRLTARVENAASIRARLKVGFLIVDYDPSCYGSRSTGGARLVMSKRIHQPGAGLPRASLLADGLLSEASVLPRSSSADLEDLLSPEERSPIGISVRADPSAHTANMRTGIDHVAHEMIELTLDSGYAGVALLKPGEWVAASDESGSCLLIFIDKNLISDRI